MNGERASPFGPMLSYIYIPNSKPYTRIVLPHRERYRCFRFLFSPFFSFFFSFPPLAFQPASHQIEQFSRCSCSPCYSSPRLFSTIPRKFHLNPLITPIWKFWIIELYLEREFRSFPIRSITLTLRKTVRLWKRKKKGRKKPEETAMKVSNSTPPRCLEKGGKRGGHSLDSLEKVSGVREKEETHGEIGVRKGVERCCKTERGGRKRGRGRARKQRGVERRRRKRRRGATRKNQRGYI